MTKFTSTTSSAPDFTIVNPSFSITDKMTYLPHICALTAGQKIDEATCPKPSWLPRKAICTSKHKELPDAYHMTGFCCVSERLRDLIQYFDPDLHQFFQTQIASKFNRFEDTTNYIFNACVVKDTLDTDLSGFKFKTIDNKRMVYDGQDKASARILRRQTESGNLWRESLYLSDLYISDQFFNAAISLGIKGLKNRYVVKSEEI